MRISGLRASSPHLGRYAVHLLQSLLISVCMHTSWTGGGRAAALSSVTYYLVEAPMQRVRRGLTRRLDARFGPDRLAPAGVRSCDRGLAGGPLRRDDDT